MARLPLVQPNLGAASHVGVGGPLDHEQGAFDAANFPQSGRLEVHPRTCGENSGCEIRAFFATGPNRREVHNTPRIAQKPAQNRVSALPTRTLDPEQR